MLEQQGNALAFDCFYQQSDGQGVTGLTVTCDIYEGASKIITGASATEVGDGFYTYTLSSGSVDANAHYRAIFKTSSSSVAAKWLPALWVVGRTWVANADAATSTRAPSATALSTAQWTNSRAALLDNLSNLDAAISSLAASIWNRLTSALNTAGSIGKLLVDNIDATISSRLSPTTAGRSLDVTATGAAGIDWGNVENQTTEVNLTNTTIEDVINPVDAVASTTVVTLSQVRAILPEQVDTGDIAFPRGDSMSLQLTGLGSLTGYTSLWFSAKRSLVQEDSEALIQIKKNTSGSGDGLLYYNGEAASDATKGSITIDDAAEGDITIALDDSIARLLPPGDYTYDVQMLKSGQVTTLTQARFTVLPDVTRAVA